ncbi:hypothetical protein [Arenicella xantha]|uniref:hypothetical protein n=1 Tax=Arenicella xantha TaxID=644221 RepID=UPI0011BF3810|nr:hypothetical protein [Arenicella xantha]
MLNRLRILAPLALLLVFVAIANLEFLIGVEFPFLIRENNTFGRLKASSEHSYFVVLFVLFIFISYMLGKNERNAGYFLCGCLFTAGAYLCWSFDSALGATMILLTFVFRKNENDKISRKNV